MSNDTSQLDRLDALMNRYYEKFGLYPIFDGMSENDMASDTFIRKLERAIETDNPDIDVSDIFPGGRNI